MFNQVRKFAPPNSIIFLADPTGNYVVPKDMANRIIAATSTCVAIGTLAEMDGQTTVRLSNEIDTPADTSVFSGLLNTPGLQIAVIDSGANVIMSMEVDAVQTHLRIWINDPSEPDIIAIQAR